MPGPALSRAPDFPLAARAGIGLRSPHHRAVSACLPDVGFLEVHSENFMAPAPMDFLRELRHGMAISLHGVGLSLGSAGGIDSIHLERLALLAAAVEPVLVSEHLSWSRSGDVFLNDLCPLPYTAETLAVVCANVERTQDRLKRAILVENPSAYLRYHDDDYDEAEFLAALARRTGCGLLVDVNNLAVNAFNHGEDPLAWLDAIPPALVQEIHLAGHVINDADGEAIAIDDHGSRVSEKVWTIYRHAVGRFGPVPAVVEWDSDIPALEVLVAEAHRADRIGTPGEVLLADAR